MISWITSGWMLSDIGRNLVVQAVPVVPNPNDEKSAADVTECHTGLGNDRFSRVLRWINPGLQLDVETLLCRKETSTKIFFTCSHLKPHPRKQQFSESATYRDYINKLT